MSDLLNSTDWLVIVGYFLAVFGIAIWVSLREMKEGEQTADYFLAGRNVGWFVIGASLFASNIGAEHLVGLAGAGASQAGGVAVAQYEVIASFMLLLLGWVFVPFYLKSNVFTMPEFLERRYSSTARWYLAVISVIAYVLTKISVTLAAAGIVLTVLTGIDFWVAAVIIVLITGVYTVLGGLRAVLYTDLLQMFILIGGAVIITITGLQALGGWDAMMQQAGSERMNMWKSINHPEFPWTGIIFGAPILGVWYWCTDQFIVQRVLSAKNIQHARGGAIMAGYLKLLPLFLFVVPGVIAYCLMQQGQLSYSYEKPDEAFPQLIKLLLAPGIRGLIVAGLLAALMSSLSSVFNSCSTLITCDIYQKLRPQASQRQLVWVGRVATIALVGVSLAWIPLMKELTANRGLFGYLQAVQAYISPPIAAVFLLGICFKRLNAQGAIASLVGGFVIGATRFVLEVLNKSEKIVLSEGWINDFVTMNFLHFAILLFVICTAILVVVSMLTPAGSESQLKDLTFATLSHDVEKKRSKLSVINLIISLFLGVLIIAIWCYFSNLGS